MSTRSIPLQHITGLVLAGGLGRRMGGQDKGLVLHQGQALAAHALQRLQSQVGVLAVNANRNTNRYEALGETLQPAQAVPVWPDALDGFAGPLAGLHAGLLKCRTPWLVTVPCDTPDFPLDLVARLAQAAAQQGTPLAMAVSQEGGQLRRQPVFCLASVAVTDRLVAYLASGERKVDRWAMQLGVAEVVFDDPRAFFNANTAEELAALGTAITSKR
jgi:molybdenum cofactor guanylyltransferase